MNKFLLSGAALAWLSFTVAAQVPSLKPAAKPAATPRPRPGLSYENQLMQAGGFEMPRVWRRSPRDEGGNLVKFGQGEWLRFSPNVHLKDRQVLVGLTNETARSGKQALYAEFDHAKTDSAAYDLSTALLRVKPNSEYRVAIWGRLDAKHPLLIDQRLPLLRMQVDFFQADEETQTGESEVRVQPMPGTPNRDPFFTAEAWSEYFAKITSPADAAFIRVIWTWGLAPGEGETNGTIYFDDAGISGEVVDLTAEPKGAPAPVKPEETAGAAAPAAATR